MTTDALIDHPHVASCKNCGATTSGNFCQQCGQATHLHVPSAREFLHEFIAHYVALEGKLWNSLKLLLFKPGFLTREYIEGRRVRYVEPLRLYLTFSIIFFALFKLSGVEMISVHSNTSDSPPALSAPAAVPPAQAAKDKEEEQDMAELKRKLVDGIGKYSGRLAQGTGKFMDLPRERQQEALKRAFFSYTPYAIFLLMPVFALYLKLLYLGSGRRYGEHFLFALHSNAFAFMMLSLFIAAYMSNFIRFLLVVWLVFYLPTAMRRVYGGGRALTALRWAVLMVLHAISLGLAVALAVGLVLVG